MPIFVSRDAVVQVMQFRCAFMHPFSCGGEWGSWMKVKADGVGGDRCKRVRMRTRTDVNLLFACFR